MILSHLITRNGFTSRAKCNRKVMQIKWYTNVKYTEIDWNIDWGGTQSFECHWLRAIYCRHKFVLSLCCVASINRNGQMVTGATQHNKSPVDSRSLLEDRL